MYFRNKKTRQIVEDNPLDDLYRMKIQDIKRIEGAYGVANPISEESALRESSGIMRPSQSLRKS
jgi:hypothetical protein